MSVLNSETERETISQMRGFICALILLAGFGLIWCVGYYSGLAIKGRVENRLLCTRGYSGAPCRPN